MHTTRRNSRKGMLDYLVIMSCFLVLIFMVVFTLNNNNKLSEENSSIKYQLNIYKHQTHQNNNKIEVLDSINKELMEDLSIIEEENASLKETISNSSSTWKENIQFYGGSFKSWTNYNKLNKDTKNYKLCNSAAVDSNGLLVKDGAYLVAMGTGWGGGFGSKFQIILDTGVTFEVMLCDIKADKDTDPSNTYTVSNGCIVEFYVNEENLNADVKQSGNISSIRMFKGNIIGVIRIG